MIGIWGTLRVVFNRTDNLPSAPALQAKGLSHPGEHPVVTHVPMFTTTHKLMSQQLVVARPVQQKTLLYYPELLLFQKTGKSTSVNLSKIISIFAIFFICC